MLVKIKSWWGGWSVIDKTLEVRGYTLGSKEIESVKKEKEGSEIIGASWSIPESKKKNWLVLTVVGK